MDVVGAHLAVADHPVAGELKAGNAKVDYVHIRCYHLPDAKREISITGIRYDRWGQTASWICGRSRSEEHTSELQSLMRISYAVFCLKKKKKNKHTQRRNKQPYINKHMSRT